MFTASPALSDLDWSLPCQATSLAAWGTQNSSFSSDRLIYWERERDHRMESHPQISSECYIKCMTRSRVHSSFGETTAIPTAAFHLWPSTFSCLSPNAKCIKIAPKCVWSLATSNIVLITNKKPQSKYLPLCAGLSRDGPHRFICWNAWPMRTGTIRMPGLVGGSAFL